MKVSLEDGIHLHYESLERRALLSANPGATQVPAVETLSPASTGGVLNDASSLSHAGAVHSSVNVAVSRNVAAEANNSLAKHGGTPDAPAFVETGIGSLIPAVGNVANTTAGNLPLPMVFDSFSTIVSRTMQNANNGPQNFSAFSALIPDTLMTQPMRGVTSMTAVGVGASSGASTDLLSTFLNNQNNTLPAVQPTVSNQPVVNQANSSALASLSSVNQAVVGLAEFNQASTNPASSGEDLLSDLVLGLGVQMPTARGGRGQSHAHLLAHYLHSVKP